MTTKRYQYLIISHLKKDTLKDRRLALLNREVENEYRYGGLLDLSTKKQRKKGDKWRRGSVYKILQRGLPKASKTKKSVVDQFATMVNLHFTKH